MNIASIGTIVSYILYWFIVIAALVYMKLKRQRLARAGAAEDAMLDSNLSSSPDEFVLEDKKDELLVERQNLKEEVEEDEEIQTRGDVVDLKQL